MKFFAAPSMKPAPFVAQSGSTRAAVIGAGLISKQHLAALRQTPHVDIVGVCDLSPVMAESTADRFGVAAWFVDYREMLERTQPHVVHITTPAASHAKLAIDALQAGAHVLVEKPIAPEYDAYLEMAECARSSGRWLIEDHNYLFNSEVQEILGWRNSGAMGDVRHVEIQLALDIFGKGSRFADPDLPHPAMLEPLGAASDFMTHLCYLAHAFTGPHADACCHWRAGRPDLTSSPTEFHALINGERASAAISFSGTAQPDAFTLRVHGAKLRAETNLFEAGIVSSRAAAKASPLTSIVNARGRARDEKRNARRNLLRKLSGGPGSYEGLWTLIRNLYDALQRGGHPPIADEDVSAVNRLIHDLQAQAEAPCMS
jgi:predicted dehydrogenase